jgi:hypothetical protein
MEFTNPDKLKKIIMGNLKKQKIFDNYNPYLKKIGIQWKINELSNCVSKMVDDVIKLDYVSRSTYFGQFAKKVDVFSIGMTILILLNNSDDSLSIRDEPKYTLINILKKSIDMNAFERINISEFKNIFKDFVSNNNNKLVSNNNKLVSNDSNKSINTIKYMNTFTINTLKEVAKTLKLKQSGNKLELYERVKPFL